MINKQTVIFDMDGTMIDSGPGIISSLEAALGELGITTSPKVLRTFIGPPLMDSFKDNFNMNGAEVREAIVLYRKHFREKGLYDNTLYPFMDALIQGLVQQGKKVLVATTKPEVFALDIIKQHKLEALITFTAGSNLDGTRTDKAEVLARALAKGGVTQTDSALMVGDTVYDIIGARKLGLDSVGVLYGFGTREELEKEKPTAIVEQVPDLAQLLRVPLP